MQFACQRAVGSVGRDETRNRDTAAVGEEARDLGYAADVLGAVAGRKSEVLVEAEADVVAVETVCVQVVGRTEEGLFQGDGYGGFARGGEPGQPDCEAGLVAKGGAEGGGDGGGVVG